MADKKKKRDAKKEKPKKVDAAEAVETAAETAAPAETPEPKSKKKKKKDAEPAEAPPAEPVAETPPAEPAAEAAPEEPKKKKGKKKKDAAAEEPTPAPEGEAASEAPPVESNGSSETTEEPTDVEPPVNLEELGRTIEALLFAAEEPIAAREIARASGSDSATVRKVIPQIKEAYDQQRKPWDIVEVAGGYRLVTRPEFYPAIQRLKTQTSQRKLTQAALETLALIAYRQPIGRAEVESVRGVGAGPVLRILLDKKLIKISGRGTGLGQPLLYGTTDYFLEHFGLKSIQDLPKPGEFKGA